MADGSVDDALLAEHLPDIHTLFRCYDGQYFEGLLGACRLEWSGRMTRCAGLCYSSRGPGGRHCTIRLSRPLLQFRPFADTINTLLHEMIHAYLFLRHGGSLQRDGHGTDFQALMHRVNARAGTSITVHHTFHAEVRALRTHVWRCQGPCRQRAPFYGWCRRAVNRPPQPADWWWAQHQRSCGGTYAKVAGATPPAAGHFARLRGGVRLGGDEPPEQRQSTAAGTPAATCTIDPTSIIDLTRD